MYEVPKLNGRTIIVTGANSGTGREAAKRLAAAGAEVIMAVRTPGKGETAREEIVAEFPDANLEVRRLDLAELASVQEFADRLISDGRTVHALVNNAGVMAPPKRLLTSDGFELQFGSNFLGPFALTMRLLPLLLEADRPRVVTMSSAAANFGKINFGDLQCERSYSPFMAYGQSKLADMLFGIRLAQISTEHGWPLLSATAHPGFTRTNLQKTGPNLGRDKESRFARLSELDFLPTQEAEAGAEPLLFATVDPAAIQGGYYGPTGRLGMVGESGLVKMPKSARKPTLARSLWAVAEDLTGMSLPVDGMGRG